MSFVNPAFLIALSAISIPIIIHLIQLRKYKKLYFSNVSFLRSIEEQQRKTNKLKHLLVLLARILTIIFIVLAFAQPYIPFNNSKLNSGKNYISIYVDNSFSLERQGENGTLFDEAKRKAREIASAFKSDDQFQLLGNEFSGNQQRWLSKESFFNSLAELKIRPESRSLQQVINRQRSFLDDKSGRSSKAFIISDFQKSFAKNATNISLDSSIEWQLVLLENSKNQNLSIDSVWFYSPVHFPNSQENLVVKIHNYSDLEVSALPYEIKINGQVIGVGNVSIGPNATMIDTFSFKNKSNGWQKGLISIKDQSSAFDNDYYFNYEIEKSRKLCIINGVEASNNIEAVFKTEPFFETKSFNYQQIDYSFLDKSQIIVLNELNDFSSGLLSQIEKRLNSSAVVIVLPTLNTEAKTNDFNQKFNLANLMPLKTIKDKIERVNFNNNLFDGVFIKQNNTNLDLPNINKYYPFSVNGQLKEELLFLSNNQSVLNKYSVQNGVIYQFAMPLNTIASDLPKHALLVPMLLRMGTIHHKNNTIAYFLGENANIQLPGIQIDERNKNELSKDQFSIVPELKSIDGTPQLAITDQIYEAGIYSLKQNDKVIADIAFNTNRAESDMTELNSSVLKDILQDKAKILNPGNASLASIIKEEEFGQRLWKICVILALFFMGLEILFIRLGDRFFDKKNNN